MGEALQWGKVCNGFSAPLQIFRGEGLQWGEGLQYNTGPTCRYTTTSHYLKKVVLNTYFAIISNEVIPIQKMDFYGDFWYITGT